MNFCGTRIKTESAVEKTIRKSEELLEVKKGMWKCERQAIKKHNDKILLQNKGALLSTLQTMDMLFLGKLDNDKNPVFGVFPTTSFDCKLKISFAMAGTISNINCGGLPKIIGDGYRAGLKGKKLRKTSSSSYRSQTLSASFVGLLPQTTKDKIVALKEASIPTFLVADTQWQMTALKAVNPDPLLIALFGTKVYLVDVFDASIEENYVASEFAEDQKEEG